MTARDFCFWLQGYFELSSTPDLTENQVATIKRHLEMAFFHDIDPSMGSKAHQEKLNGIHLEWNSSLPHPPVMRC